MTVKDKLLEISRRRAWRYGRSEFRVFLSHEHWHDLLDEFPVGLHWDGSMVTPYAKLIFDVLPGSPDCVRCKEALERLARLPEIIARISDGRFW